jgi:small GTP-binding protein
MEYESRYSSVISGDLTVNEITIDGLDFKGMHAFVNLRLEDKKEIEINKSKGKQRSKEVKCEKRCTSVTWDEKFSFLVSDISQVLIVRIWDKKLPGSTLIGTLDVPISSFISNLGTSVDFNSWYKVPEHNVVKIHLRFVYKPYNTNIVDLPSISQTPLHSVRSIRMVFVGDPGIGKTCALIRYMTNDVPGEYWPTLYDEYHVTVTCTSDMRSYDLKIVDTGGLDDHDKLRPLAYYQLKDRVIDVFILAFDIVNRESFENIRMKWYPEIVHHCPNKPIILMGCKSDLESDETMTMKLILEKKPPVSLKEAEDLCKEIGALKYTRCSSFSSNGNLNEVFSSACTAALKPPPKIKNFFKKKSRLLKAEININKFNIDTFSSPVNFEHFSNISLDSENGFSVKNIPDAWKPLFGKKQSGIDSKISDIEQPPSPVNQLSQSDMIPKKSLTDSKVEEQQSLSSGKLLSKSDVEPKKSLTESKAEEQKLLSPPVKPSLKDSFFGRMVMNIEDDSRMAISPFICLQEGETVLSLEESVKLGYDDKFPKVQYDMFFGYGDDMYNSLVDTCNLTKEESIALYLYTCEWGKDINLYAFLNAAMASSNRINAKKWSHYLHYLLGGLTKIPIWKSNQDLYRAVSLDLVNLYPKKYQIGKKITWYSCTSTTTQLQSITNFLPKDTACTIFTINGTFSGRPLQIFSALPNEFEVLLPPASRFEIVSVVPVAHITMIQLRQIPTLEKVLNLEPNDAF